MKKLLALLWFVAAVAHAGDVSFNPAMGTVTITSGTINGATIGVTTPAQVNGTSFTLPAADSNHGGYGITTLTNNYFGTSGTLTGVTGTTHANTTLDSLPVGHGITNSQYISISGETGCFVTSAVGATSLTLSRATSTSTAGHTIQYCYINDVVLNIGYNIGANAKASEPSWVWVIENDYLDADGYRKMEQYWQYQNSAATVQIRPFFVQINRDLDTLTQTILRAGTATRSSGGGGFILKNADATRSLLIVDNAAAGTNGTAYFDSNVSLVATQTIPVLTLDSSVYAGSAGGTGRIDFYGGNASSSSVNMAQRAWSVTTTTAGSENAQVRDWIMSNGALRLALEIQGLSNAGQTVKLGSNSSSRVLIGAPTDDTVSQLQVNGTTWLAGNLSIKSGYTLTYTSGTLSGYMGGASSIFGGGLTGAADIGLRSATGGVGLAANSTTPQFIIASTGHATLSTDLVIGGSSLTVTTGALGLSKMTASASAPGAGGFKFEGVCGTNAGTGKIIVYAGTSTTASTVLDNIGAGVTGC